MDAARGTRLRGHLGSLGIPAGAHAVCPPSSPPHTPPCDLPSFLATPHPAMRFALLPRHPTPRHGVCPPSSPPHTPPC
eukprot:327969-Chlamydomonas_euryale.AAC.2